MAAPLDLGIDLDLWPWIWLATAVVFALVELIVVGGSFIVLPFAVSAFIAAVLAFYDVGIEIQWSVFVFGGGILFVVLYRWAQRFMRDHPMAPGVGADRLVGMTAVVTRAVVPGDADRAGRVTIDGEVWGVADAEQPFEVGRKVRVIAMKGTRVVVTPLDEPTAAGGEE